MRNTNTPIKLFEGIYQNCKLIEEIHHNLEDYEIKELISEFTLAVIDNDMNKDDILRQLEKNWGIPDVEKIIRAWAYDYQ